MTEEIETRFQSETEMAAAFDEIIMQLGERMNAEERRPGVLNPVRISQLNFCLGVMRYLTRGTDAEVSYKTNEPIKSMGSVSVVGKTLKFTDTEWFSRAAEFASNTEVYAMADGRVKLTFTFHGLTKPL